MKTQRLLVPVLALGLAACQTATDSSANLSSLDRQAILSAVDATPYAAPDFGEPSPMANSQVVGTGAQGSLALGVPVTLPVLWAVRHGEPTKTKTVTMQNDTATVNLTISYNGTFVMIVPQDGAPPETVTKPAAVTMTQTAVLVKDTTRTEDADDSVEAAHDSAEGGHQAAKATTENDDRHHHWRLIQITPQNWTMTDVSKQTIKITRVRVLVNGTTKVDVTDPTQLYDVSNRLPRLLMGDAVQVLVDVSNTAGTGNTPPTFVFLHVRHGFGFGFGWHRIPMQQISDNSFQQSWVVRERGWRDRFAVDALDSQTFQTGSGTEFRTNAWAVPYRIEP